MTSNHVHPVDRGLSAAILAGGASRRMGRDKALMTLAGQTLLERAIAGVAGVASETIIVGDRKPYHEYGVPVVPDLFPDTGPLGGIATALRQASHDHVLVVACDLPFLSPPLLKAMAQLPRDYDVLVPVTNQSRRSQSGTSTYETLHAIYARTSLLAIEHRIVSGEFQVVAALAELTVRTLLESWLREFDPNLRSFVNANHPGDWEAASALLDEESMSVEDRL